MQDILFTPKCNTSCLFTLKNGWRGLLQRVLNRPLIQAMRCPKGDVELIYIVPSLDKGYKPKLDENAQLLKDDGYNIKFRLVAIPVPEEDWMKRLRTLGALDRWLSKSAEPPMKLSYLRQILKHDFFDTACKYCERFQSSFACP